MSNSDRYEFVWLQVYKNYCLLPIDKAKKWDIKNGSICVSCVSVSVHVVVHQSV